jgi:molybdopterin-guanine dinucleotide biosynthesis adapter protein
MRVFCVSGFQNSGKTTLVTKLIGELIKRGYSVSSVKDIHSTKFTPDKKDSDSYKHTLAGSNPVFARGLKQTSVVWNEQFPIMEILSEINTDFVIIEGMKTSDFPKIICAESTTQLDEIVDGTTFAISGKISDNQTSYNHLKIFSDIRKLVDLAEDKVFKLLPFAKKGKCGLCGASCRNITEEILSGKKTRDACKYSCDSDIVLKVNGKVIDNAPFVKEILKGTVSGFVRNLKGCEKGKIEIEVE